MTSNTGFGGIVIMIGFFIVLAIIQIWYIILPIIVIIIGGYLLFRYYENKEQKRQRRARIQREIIARQNREKEQKRLIEENKIKEKKRLEEQKKKEEQERKRLYEEEQKRIKSRLDLFSFTESEAEILFGKTWKKRLAKPEKEFMEQEVGRIATKLEENAAQLLPKIIDFADKVFDMIDYYVQIRGKERGWSEIDFENWKEDWDDVRATWRETRDQYSSKKQEKTRDNSEDYYEILGISRNYSIKEIKVHYRKLMLKFHPDRNSSTNAEQKCKKINEAYEILSDPEKRKSYDQYGFIFE